MKKYRKIPIKLAFLMIIAVLCSGCGNAADNAGLKSQAPKQQTEEQDSSGMQTAENEKQPTH